MRYMITRRQRDYPVVNPQCNVCRVLGITDVHTAPTVRPHRVP